MALLLAIDTSTTDSGVALFDGAVVLAECAWYSGRGSRSSASG